MLNASIIASFVQDVFYKEKKLVVLIGHSKVLFHSLFHLSTYSPRL